MLKTNKKKIKKKKTMKNDILLFALMFAVAWIGFGALKDHLQLPTVENTVPAATNSQSANLIADMTADDSGNSTKSKSTQKENDSRADESRSDQAKSKTASATETALDSDSSQSPEQVIEQVLMDQTKAWNSGDLDGFMDAYWNNENLTFSGAGGTTVGYEDTYANYRDRYPEGKMGQISFKDLKTEMVGEESAIVTGRFDHQLPDEKVKGNFSLVLKILDGKWKIIHDHTSVAK